MDTIKIDRKNTKIIAHRGLSGIECENTCAAFVAAGNRDYYGIESDVHKTVDGKFIIIHDDTTGRVAIKDFSVENSSYEVLRSLHLPDKDGKLRGDLCLPSLSEYLRICKRYEKSAVLELKNPFSKEDIAEILKVIRKEYDYDRLVFISFDYQNLVYLRELLPTAQIQFLCSCKVDNELIGRLNKYNFDLDIYYSWLSPENIKTLHGKGIRVNCWTVDNKPDAEKLTSWGVDFITTNILQ